MTGTDPLGRLVGKYVYSASNAFKIDKWHNLFLTKSHHPINITQEAYMELFDLAGEWFLHVNKVDPEYRYPQFAWDVLPKAGASQIQPHIYATLTRYRYYGGLQTIHNAAQIYIQDTGRNYFTDLVEIHTALYIKVQLQLLT